MSEEGDDKFRALTQGFGLMESQLGQEAYQANVENAKVHAEMMRVNIEAQQFNIEAAKERQVLVGGLVTVVTYAMIIPYLIFVYWLFRTLVI